jgi:glycosyltransferase involved in cell wall biosynthesis
MDICFIDVYNPLPINSGGDWYRHQLLEDLSESNCVTEYYTFEIEKKEGYLPPETHFRTIHLNSQIPWYKISTVLDILKLDYLFKDTSYVKTDIVFFSTVCYHIASRIARKSKLPLVLVMHNVEWQYLKSNRSLLWPFMKLYEHYIYTKADAIIAISPKDYDYVTKYISNDKVFLIPPKVDENIFTSNGLHYEYGKDKLNLLFYGSLDRKQNIDALKFIVNQLVPKLNERNILKQTRINIFGSGKVPEEINLNVEGINYIGAVKNPGEYVRGADVVLVPMKNIGGIKIRILESLACGKVIIATPEAIRGLPSEYNELVFLADDSDDFVETINMFIKNRHLLDKNKAYSDEYLKGYKTGNVIDFLFR